MIIRRQLQTIFLFKVFSNPVHPLQSASELSTQSFMVPSIRWIGSGTEGEIEATTPEMLGQFRQSGWTLKVKNNNGRLKT